MVYLKMIVLKLCCLVLCGFGWKKFDFTKLYCYNTYQATKCGVLQVNQSNINKDTKGNGKEAVRKLY